MEPARTSSERSCGCSPGSASTASSCDAARALMRVARRVARLDLPRLAVILAAPTTGAPGLTQAGVLPQWHLADPCLSDRGCSDGGTADRDVPELLADALAGGHHRLRLRAAGPSRLSAASCSERRGAHAPLRLLSGPLARQVRGL